MTAERRPGASQRLARLAAFASLVLASTPAAAQNLRKLANETELTGDWGGARTKLEAERRQDHLPVLHQPGRQSRRRPRAGLHLHRQPQPRDRPRLGEARLRGRAARFHFIFTNRDGTSLTQNVHRQHLHGPADLRADRDVPADRDDARAVLRRRRLGRASRGATRPSDFATSPLYCVFMNNGFCGYPGGIAQNLNMPYFPVPSWAGRVRWKPRPGVARPGRRLRGQPDARRHARVRLVHERLDRHGRRRRDLVRARRRRAGPARPLQARRLVPDAGRAPLAAARARRPRRPAAPRALRRRSRARPPAAASKGGVYALVDQNARREGRPGTRSRRACRPGVTVLGGASWAQGPTTINDVAAFGGVIANGMLAGRPFDTQGFAVDVGRTSRCPGRRTRWCSSGTTGSKSRAGSRFQPDLQWVVRPGATGQIPNALVIGAQAVLDF